MQDKQSEIAFFDRFASEQQYDVFEAASSRKIVETCIELAGLKSGMIVADLGSGSGAFTHLLMQHGIRCLGVDLSFGLLVRGRREEPTLRLTQGDVEHLPFSTGSLDGVVLSGIVHHLPDATYCAREVYRVLKPGASFVAFDPNRRNPFMWLYRDRSSPFYSSKGVTENERPVIASEVARVFAETGFRVSTSFLSSLRYRYIASSVLHWALPIYNFLDNTLFRPALLKSLRAFVFTSGVK